MEHTRGHFRVRAAAMATRVSGSLEGRGGGQSRGTARGSFDDADDFVGSGSDDVSCEGGGVAMAAPAELAGPDAAYMGAVLALRRSLLAMSRDAAAIRAQLALVGGGGGDGGSGGSGGGGADATEDEAAWGFAASAAAAAVVVAQQSPPAARVDGSRDGGDVGGGGGGGGGGGSECTPTLLALKRAVAGEAATFMRLAGRAQLVLGQRWAALDDAPPGSPVAASAAARVVADAGSLAALAAAAASITAWGAAAAGADEALLSAYARARDTHMAFPYGPPYDICKPLCVA